MTKRTDRRAETWAVALVGTALTIGFVLHAWHWQFTQDDAYISLRYARNLVEGHGLVFNPGERVEGYSNFTWTVLLAGLLKLGAPAVEASRWLGVAFGALAMLWAARFGRALEGKWGVGALAGALLVGANPAFALWSTGGLETALFTFLVVAGLERGLAPGVGSRGRAAAPLLLAAAALTRPDGPLVFALWFAVRAFDTWRGGPAAAEGGRRELARDLGLFVAPLIPYAAWKFWYYGDLLPNTYYAKAGISTDYLGRGVDYALDWFRSYGLFGVAPALALLGAFVSGVRGVPLRLLAIWCGVAAYIVLIGGDVLLLHRFWLPLLPIGALLIGQGVSWLATRFLPGSAARTGAIALLLLLAGVGAARNLAVTGERRDQEMGLVRKMLANGEWLRRNLDPDATIAATTIGAIAYNSRLRVIDMLGLTDREIAHHPRPFPGLTDTWRERKYNAESVLRRRPDAIFFSTDIRPSSAAERALYLYEDFHRSYYAYYFRSVPGMAQKLTCFRPRGDAPAFSPETVETRDYRFIQDYINAHLDRAAQPRKALALFERASAEGPPGFLDALEWRAVTLDELNDPARIDALVQVTEQDPWAVAAHVRLAQERLIARQDDEARRLFERVRTIDPHEADAWAGLAELERRRRNLPEALELAKKAVSLWTASPALLLLLGNLSLQNGDLELAHQVYDHLDAIAAPDDPVRASVVRSRQALRAVETGLISLEQLNSADAATQDGR